MNATGTVRIGQQFRSGCTSEALETARLEGDVAMPYDAPMQQELSFVRVDPLEVHSKVAWLQKARWPVD